MRNRTKTFVRPLPNVQEMSREGIRELLEQKVVGYIGAKRFRHEAWFGSALEESTFASQLRWLALISFGKEHGADYVVPGVGYSGSCFEIMVDLYKKI